MEEQLSNAQQRMWMLHRMDPESAAYNVAFGLVLDEQTDAEAMLKRALDVFAATPALRVRFVGTDCTRQQLDPAPFTERVEHLEHPMPTASVDLQRVPAVAAAINAPFDLEAEAPLRIYRYRFACGRSLLLFVAHHIVVDELSCVALLETICGDASDMPAPWTHGQQLERERRRLEERRQALLDFWQAELLGLPEPLFPARAVRGMTDRRVNSRTRVWELSPTSLARVDTLARSLRLSRFQVFLLLIGSSLGRLLDRADLVIGVPVTLRQMDGDQRAIGLFQNTLPIRLRFEGAPSLAKAGRMIAKTFARAYGHVHLPFELISEQAPRRDVFDVLLNYNDHPSARRCDVEYVAFDPDEAQFPLTVSIRDGALGCRVTLQFLSEHVTDPFADTLLQTLEFALQQSSEQALEPLMGQPYLPEEALRAITHLTNPHPEPLLDVPVSVLDLFAGVVERQPQAVAVGDTHTRLTYRALETRSGALARRLLQMGHRTGDRIGILIERSADQVVAIMAVARAGCTFVPLDPIHPPERLRYMLDDAGAVSVLARTPVEWLPDHVRTVRLAPEDDPRPMVHLSLPSVHGALPLYIMYTSGSTGRPKGIAVTHRNVTTMIAAFARFVPLDHQDRCTLWASSGFDVSVYELFSALCAGAQLLIPSDAVRLDTRQYLEWLRRERVSATFLMPFLIPGVLNEVRRGGNLPLKKILTGVEPMPRRAAGELLGSLPGLHLVNSYGPTETTFASTAIDCRSLVQRDGIVPLGHSIPGTNVFVLDRHLQRVPIGVPGEVYISGEGLALGYIGNPRLTAEAFLPNPFGPSGSRMYRTGDTAQILPDGSLEFLGRFNRQVKLRGFRIELSEVEAVVLEHPAIELCHAFVDGDGPDRQLVVAVQTPHPISIIEGAVIAACNTRLPPYMMPDRIVILAEFIKTANGKIDWRAVEDMAGAPRGETVVTARTDELGTLVRSTWLAVLGIVDFDDNQSFFELGGDSLRAIQVQNRLKSQLGVAIPMRTMFDVPYIRKFTRRVEDLLRVARLTPPTTAAVQVARPNTG